MGVASPLAQAYSPDGSWHTVETIGVPASNLVPVADHSHELNALPLELALATCAIGTVALPHVRARRKPLSAPRKI
jgi:hypothetical protein